MQKERFFNYEEIVRALRYLKIPFRIEGAPCREHYSFKSLKSIGLGGIFYISPGFASQPVLHDSIVLSSDIICEGQRNVVVQVDNPQLVFYKLMSKLVGRVHRATGVHPTAIVGDDCDIDPSASIGPYCVLDGCQVGANVQLYAHVVVMPGSLIEEDVVIEPHSTIGATGVAWAWDPVSSRRVVQPQIGFTTIARGTFLGSDVTVVRGSVNETTYLGEGCVVAHGSKIGHGTSIGAGSHLANNVAIAGNVSVGERCFLGSAAVVRPQVSLTRGVIVAAGAVVVGDCFEEGALLKGVPAKSETVNIKTSLRGVPRPLD